MRACVVGSTNVDLVLTVADLPRPGETVLARQASREPGGKGANQASAAARLGADVRFVSAVGKDEAGAWSLEALAAEGVDTAQVAVLPGLATGLAVVMVDSVGENVIVVTPGANHHVRPPASYDGVDVVLLSMEIPVASVLATAVGARAAGVSVVLNAAPASELPAALLGAVDVLVLNEPELASLGGDADALRSELMSAVVVTKGSAGCLLVDDRGRRSFPAARVEAVDTTGAGDCFAAALACGVGWGWPIDRSVQLALTAAGRCVTGRGARGGLPHRDQIDLELGPGLPV